MKNYIAIVALLIGSTSSSHLAGQDYFDTNEPLEFGDLLYVQAGPVDTEFVQEKYGDITVTIAKRQDGDPDMVPDRYSQDSDDHLMNTLISKGYAFSREKGAHLKIQVDCGCNCNCCMGQKKEDLWEVSKDCGCDCGCCNMNKEKVKQSPQFWVNKDGALKAARELVQRNLKLQGQALEEYLNRNFGETWEHFDVLNKGIIEVEQMSSFYKTLLKDFTMSIQ